jgi:myo-inositol-1(or 4)-monophosphatase
MPSTNVVMKTGLALPPTRQAELNAAITAARRGGEIAMARYGRPSSCWGKQENVADALDYLSDVDLAVEAELMRSLRASFPEYGFLSEEDGGSGASETRWILDPIDGSLNYLAGLPFFSISIALECRGQIVLGVVYSPASGELYSAESGGGAFRNDSPIRVSQRTSLSDAVLACTIDKRPEPRATVLRQLDLLGSSFKSVICLQASSVALCLLAAGKLDALVDYGCYWDFAAGQLIASVAGAAVSDWSGAPFRQDGGYLLAANPRLHRELSMRVVPPPWAA